MQQIAFQAMGCHMQAVLDTEHADTRRYLHPVSDWFDEWERQLSRFYAQSTLSQLNRNSGLPFCASDVLWNVVKLACDAAKQSDGLVTPVVLDALEAAGYDRSFMPDREQGTVNGEREFGKHEQKADIRARPLHSWQAIQMDTRTHTICLPEGMRLDLGGVAKGWAAMQTVQNLHHYGPILVDAGGDIAVSGPMSGGKRWPIGIADPLKPESQIELIMLHRGGVATSGRDYRRWQHHGRWQHHLIDPRSGCPAETDIMSVTIVAPSVCEAEVAAKVVCIQGSTHGLHWLEARSSLAGLLVLESGKVLRSRRLKHVVW
jgi:FAD:protein FMN transferase